MKMRVTINDQEFDVEIADLKCRPIIATVDGQSFEVWPEGSAPAPAADLSLDAAPVPQTAGSTPVTLANPAKAVTAPIPGTIVAVLVKEGQAVKFGQELLTLEAMKMKNAIKATREAKIGAIHVQVGDQVRHSQVLIEYAD
jgi:biotin carboxyl carrier protein